jgi:TPR repeat protein
MSFTYPANANIIQGFVELQESFPPLHNSYQDISTVKAWLKHIKNLGFTDEMMQEVIVYFYKLKNQQKYEEASQMLLVSAATEHELASFILARELVLGQLFEKNEAAAFGMLNTLAEHEHLDSICDLAYFYKNGLVVEKDIATAKHLYKKAADAGLKRAQQSYNRLLDDV